MKENIRTDITVKDTSIRIMRVGNTDYISLTDLARFTKIWLHYSELA